MSNKKGTLVPSNKITIGGMTGTGTSTLGKLLAEKMEWKFFSGGQIIRDMIANMGVTDADFKEMRKSDPKYDNMLDDKQRDLGNSSEGVVLESRLGHHFIPHSFKVLLVCDDGIRVRRVFERDSQIDPSLTIQGVQESDYKRNQSDMLLHAKLYGIPNYLEKSRYDLVLNSGGMNPDQLAAEVAEKYQFRSRLSL